MLQSGPKCAACGLSKEDRAFVVEMRAKAPALAWTAIAKGLRAGGVQITPESLSRHSREGHGQEGHGQD